MLWSKKILAVPALCRYNKRKSLQIRPKGPPGLASVGRAAKKRCSAVEKKVIVMDQRKQLRSLANPTRQAILRLLRLSPRAVTVMELADQMMASPTSVQYHVDKLMELGLVEADHVERSRGVEAVHYRDADVELRMPAEEAETVATQLVDGTFRKYMQALGARAQPREPEAYGVLLSGVLHLEEGERKELFQLVRNYLTTHDQPARDKGEHWEYMVMAYRSGNEQ